jgi:cysteine desulfuration protein SufE
MTLTEKLEFLLADYEPIADPQERMALVVESIPAATRLPEALRTDEHRIRGCISAAWLVGELKDGHCQFRCAADSPLVGGLLACLCHYFSGATPAEIINCELDPLLSLGLTRNLSPTRLNGLTQARRRIRDLAASLA